MNQEELTEPPLTQQDELRTSLSPILKNQDEALEEENDEYGDSEREVELCDNTIGNLDLYHTQENMDHDIPFSRMYVSDSDEDGPDEEVDEEGFTKDEAEVHEKVLGRDHRVPLFRDLSLADEATVDGGKGVVLGPRPTSYRDVSHEKNGISKGQRFATLLELKQWIKDFSIRYHRPFTVVHSDVKKRYTVKCEDDGCPWIVRARPYKGGRLAHFKLRVNAHVPWKKGGWQRCEARAPTTDL